VSFPRYEKYKDSGIEWLGQVPEHWSVVSIKWLSPVQRGASPRPIDDPKYFDDEGEFAWVRIADVSASDGMLRETAQQLSSLGSSLSVKMMPGDLFVSIAGTVGKPCITAIKCCIHDGFVYFPSLRVDPRYLYRIFECGICYGGLGKMGTQLNLNTDTIGSIRVAVPPADELVLLMEFVDRETVKIDALVEEQQCLIELLKEKRQAVISHAVTKGLNPNAPMKDSGVEWLGEVPSHWSLLPLKFVAGFRSGWTPDKANAEFWDGDVPWASAKDMKAAILRDTIDHITVDAIEAGAADLIEAGTPVVVVRGMILARLLPVCTLGVPMAINQDLKAVIALGNSRPDYLAWLLRASEPETLSRLDEAGHGTKALRMDAWTAMRVPVPPLCEQKGVADFLDQETARIDALTAQAIEAVRLLHERRTALISAAVTGKIDVRGLEPATCT
jgi:type I restriction enzyme S subunit